MELWALIDNSTSEVNRHLGDAVELYLGESKARRALTEVLEDEPEWEVILSLQRVATVELSRN